VNEQATEAAIDETKPSTLFESVCELDRVAIVFNPVSGVEDSVTRRTGLEELARAGGLTCDLVETDAERGATPLVEQAMVDGMERIIVSGGDGSVAEAAHAMAGSHATLAVVPGGTGNLIALNLGIPTDREEAMRLALGGAEKPTDVGRVNGLVFLVGAGMGLDARIMRDADRELKSRYGKLAYFIAGARNLGRRHTRYSITVDGVRYQRYAQTVLIANLGLITGGLELVPGSDPDDGILEVAILRTRRLRDFLVLALRAIAGRARSDDKLEILRGRQIVVETRRPQPVQIDGNDAPLTRRLEVSVEPGALLMVRPDSLPEPNPVAVLASSPHTRYWIPGALGIGLASIGFWYLKRRH